MWFGETIPPKSVRCFYTFNTQALLSVSKPSFSAMIHHQCNLTFRFQPEYSIQQSIKYKMGDRRE